MNARVGQVWEWKSVMNGERVVVVMESTPTTPGRERGTVHKVLHITGKKLGRVVMCTEMENEEWENHTYMTRLD